MTNLYPFLLLIAFLIPTTIFSATIHVPGDSATIQAGINGAVDGDTVLVAPGIYTGEGNRKINLDRKSLVVISEAGPMETTIDCQGSGLDGFNISQGSSNKSFLSGFRIINANNAIYVYGGELTVESSILELSGRGIWAFSCTIRVFNCTIQNNSYVGPGAGILDASGNANSIIQNCLISNNISESNGGGILYRKEGSQYINCTIINNTALNGGGIYVEEFSDLPLLPVKNCIIWGNKAINRDSSIRGSNTNITYSNIQYGGQGQGNINANPIFMDPLADDYRLHPSSPCIDAGDPADDFSFEPAPNGGRINMGMFGNTSEASSFVKLPKIIGYHIETGCITETQITLNGINFGKNQGSGSLKVGTESINTIDTWSDTLVIFHAPIEIIGNYAILLTNSEGKTDTLSSKYLHSPVVNVVKGEIGGIWTAECPSTYLITGDVILPTTNELLIEPGVTVLIHPGLAGSQAKFSATGKLTAIGTSEEPILFSVVPQLAKQGAWGGFEISPRKAVFKEAIIEYATTGIIAHNDRVELENCQIRENSAYGVQWEGYASGKLLNNQISGNGRWGVYCAAYTGGEASSSVRPLIKGNRIFNNGGGILVEAIARTPFSGSSRKSATASPQIVNNFLTNNEGWGIKCYSSGDFEDGFPFDFFYTARSSPIIEGNIIANNGNAITVESVFYGGPSNLSIAEPQIINNTFWNNGTIAIQAIDSVNVTVQNSIFWGPVNASFKISSGSQFTMASSNSKPLFQGEGNISKDPLFFDADNSDFRLFANSPCLDKGVDLAFQSPLTIDGKARVSDGNNDGSAIVDMGAIEYHLPQIRTQPIGGTICQDEDFSLNISATGENINIQWYKNEIPYENQGDSVLNLLNTTVEDSGLYYSKVQDELNGMVYSDSVRILVNELPQVTLMPFDTVSINDAPFTLNSGIPEDGIYSGPGISNNILDPAVAGVGEHTIEYSFRDENNCSASATATIIIDQSTSIKRFQLGLKTNIYPNPASEHLFVELISPISSDVGISIYNSTGELVQFTNGYILQGENLIEVDLQELPSGSYFIRILGDGFGASGRLVLMR